MAAKIPVATDHNNESGFFFKSILKGKEGVPSHHPLQF
jgi:hypothetical protein